MLKQLHLKNFKGWREPGPIELAPITGFFGTNSSGKTSLLQAILLLKQTAESSDRASVLQFGDKGGIVELGDFASVAYQHDTGSSMELGLSWQRKPPLALHFSAPEQPVKVTLLGFGATIDAEGQPSPSPRIRVSEMQYHAENKAYGMRRGAANGDYELFTDVSDFKFERSRGRPAKLPAPDKCYGFPDQVRASFQNAGFLSQLELALEEALRSVYYLGPLRASPERIYAWTGAQPSDMGKAGANAVAAILSARERDLRISPGKRRHRVALEKYVAEWLRKLGLIESFKVAPVADGSRFFEVRVKRGRGSPEVLLTDVGFGVSQILPVIVMCFYVPEGSTVILEQPEIHLHPSVQAGLADVLIDATQNRDIQVIVESHSEHFLRRLQRRVAEQKIEREHVALYFCGSGEDGSSLRNLDVDELGNITNWPRDFFGDQFGELAQTQRARMDRLRSRSDAT